MTEIKALKTRVFIFVKKYYNHNQHGRFSRNIMCILTYL